MASATKERAQIENRVLERILLPKREEMAGGGRKGIIWRSINFTINLVLLGYGGPNM
jgi:hypothetical protein